MSAKHNPPITIKELAILLKVSTRAVEKNIAKLKSEGILQRIGADKGGFRKVKIKNNENGSRLLNQIRPHPLENSR